MLQLFTATEMAYAELPYEPDESQVIFIDNGVRTRWCPEEETHLSRPFILSIKEAVSTSAILAGFWRNKFLRIFLQRANT